MRPNDSRIQAGPIARVLLSDTDEVIAVVASCGLLWLDA